MIRVLATFIVALVGGLTYVINIYVAEASSANSALPADSRSAPVASAMAPSLLTGSVTPRIESRVLSSSATATIETRRELNVAQRRHVSTVRRPERPVVNSEVSVAPAARTSSRVEAIYVPQF